MNEKLYTFFKFFSRKLLVTMLVLSMIWHNYINKLGMSDSVVLGLIGVIGTYILGESVVRAVEAKNKT